MVALDKSAVGREFISIGATQRNLPNFVYHSRKIADVFCTADLHQPITLRPHASILFGTSVASMQSAQVWSARRTEPGFTLVELMIVVAIIGILAAIAIPSFSRYIKKSRSAEAVGHLAKIWSGAAAYFNFDHADANTTMVPRQYPTGTAPVESATYCSCLPGGRCPGGAAAFDDDIWRALTFAVSDPHVFIPGYSGTGTGSSTVFTATAQSDLDCDGTLALFQRAGGVNAFAGDPTGSSAPYIVNEGE